MRGLNYPALTPDHVAPYARLYANRHVMLHKLAANVKPMGMVVEVGVAYGDFSEHLIRELSPSAFFAIDTFVVHELEMCMGEPVGDRFKGLTHEAYYRQRIPSAQILKGTSKQGLALLFDETVDVMYLDAGHTYEDVREDLSWAKHSVKPGGLLICNDYTLFDIKPDLTAGGPYGVVQAVNEMVAGGGWNVIGFALEKHGFHDIALQRL